MSLPAGTLAFSGFGQAPMQFTAPDGTPIPAPAYTPKVGDPAIGLANSFAACSPNYNGLTSCQGVVTLDDGTFCITGTTYCLSVALGVVDYATLAPSLDPATRQGTDVEQGLRSIATGYGNGHFYGLRMASSLAPDPTYAIWQVDAAGLHTATFSLGFNHDPWGAAIGVADDESVGYYLERRSPLTAGITDTVLRGNLAGGTTTFTTETGYHSTVNGLLVRRNGDVLVGWQQASVSGYVKHYSAAGTLLHTYSLPGTGSSPVVLTPGVDDTTFWVSYYNTAVSTFSGVTVAEIDVSMGTIVHSFDPEDGTFQFDGPFCVLRAGTAPPIPPPPPGAIEPIRRLRQAPMLWDGAEGKRLKFPGFELLTEAGGPRDTDVAMPIVLQWSDDGGHSWGHEHRNEGARIGEHRYRYRWLRLGQARNRVFRVVCSADAKVVFIDALLSPDPVQGSS